MKNYQVILFTAMMVLLNSCNREDDVYGTYANIADTYGETTQGDIYAEFEENQFIEVGKSPISTFSIDADGASYSNTRRFILSDQIIPPKAAIRTEELINYFDMDYDYQPSEHPISLNGEISSCPWKEENKLIRIGIQGKFIPEELLPPSNFVFLIDVSGSMSGDDRLKLLKEGFSLFVSQMREDDRVAIVTYAGESSLHLASTSGNEKAKIISAIQSLQSGGSTAGAEGIVTAYEIAKQNYISNGNNRIILGTDGDFNVGISSRDELVKLIEEKREQGIFITIVGVGRSNLNDASLEQIANKGNGNYEYADNLSQIKKVFIDENSKFYTVAKDVKVQIEFNPNIVKAYRLIGYENRLLNTEDFEDDTKDAGEIGAGQGITAIYEIVPADNADIRKESTFKIDFRYKNPDADQSIPMSLEVFDYGKDIKEASMQMIFASCIAEFSMLLRDSPFKGSSSFNDIKLLMTGVHMPDPHGLMEEFKKIVVTAEKY